MYLMNKGKKSKCIHNNKIATIYIIHIPVSRCPIVLFGSFIHKIRSFFFTCQDKSVKTLDRVVSGSRITLAENPIRCFHI